MMRKYTLGFEVIAIILLVTGCASIPCKQYASVGTGYKFVDTTMRVPTFKNSPVSARFEIGSQCESVKYGIAHHSQWFIGWPFDDAKEHDKTEVFIDYVWSEK